MQSLLHTLAQDWSFTPKGRKSFTSPQIRRCPQLFTSAGINLASLNSSRTWEVSLPPHMISLRRFNIVLTRRPLPSGGCPSEFLRTVTFPHAPRWPFITLSASRHCSMHVRDGHRTATTSEPSRPFTFGVFKQWGGKGGTWGPRAPLQGRWHFADQKLSFWKEFKSSVIRYYFTYILKCSTAFQFSCLEALDW